MGLSHEDDVDEASLDDEALTKYVYDLVQSRRRKFTLSDILDGEDAAPYDRTPSMSSNDAEDASSCDRTPFMSSNDEGDEYARAAKKSGECSDSRRRLAFRKLWDTYMTTLSSQDDGMIHFLADIEALQRSELHTSTSDWPVDALDAVVGQLYLDMEASRLEVRLVLTFRILAKALRWKRNQAVVLRLHTDFLVRIGGAMLTWMDSTQDGKGEATSLEAVEEALQHWTTMLEVCLVGSSDAWAAWTNMNKHIDGPKTLSTARANSTLDPQAKMQCVDAMDTMNHREIESIGTSPSQESIHFTVMDQYIMIPRFMPMLPALVDCIVQVMHRARTHDSATTNLFLPLQLRLLTLLGSLCCVQRSLGFAKGSSWISFELNESTLTTLFDMLLITTKDVTSVGRLADEAQFARLVVAVALEACESAPPYRSKWALVAEKLSLLTSTVRWIQDQAMKLAMLATPRVETETSSTIASQPWLISTDLTAHDSIPCDTLDSAQPFTWCASCQDKSTLWRMAGFVASCPPIPHASHRQTAMTTVVFEMANRCYKALFDMLFVAYVCPTIQHEDAVSTANANHTCTFLEHIVMVSLDILKQSRKTLHGLSVELHASIFLQRIYDVNPASTILPNVLRKYQAWIFLLHHPGLFPDACTILQDVATPRRIHDDVSIASLTGNRTATRTHVYIHTLLSALFAAIAKSSFNKAEIVDQVTDTVVQYQHQLQFVYSITRVLDHIARHNRHLHPFVYSPANFSKLVAVLATLHGNRDATQRLQLVATLSVLRLLHRHVMADRTSANAVLHREFISQRSASSTPPQQFLPCLFALLRQRQCVPLVLDMLSTLLASATFLMFVHDLSHHSTSGDRFDFLRVHMFQSFIQSISELVSCHDNDSDDVEATVASMVGCVATLLSTQTSFGKDLQKLFRDCNAFVHLTNLLHSPRFVEQQTHIHITRQVCHVLTLLMAKNRESKAEFRTLMVTTGDDHERVAYEPLVDVFLAAEHGVPSWESMQVVWTMMLDNDLSSCRVRNPDAIPVLFCLFRHCTRQDQVKFLQQFKRLFDPSSYDVLNRSMCCYVQPGTLDQLLDALEGGVHLPEVIDVMVEIGWHSVGVHQLKRIFRLLQRPSMSNLVAPLVDALYYMIQRHVGLVEPSRFFFFDGDQSGLELAPFPFPTKGFTFHTWLRLDEYAPPSSRHCVFSWLDKHGNGHALMIRHGYLEYGTAGNLMQTTVRLEETTWYCITVVHSAGTFRLRPELAIFLNGDLAWVGDIPPVEFDGPVAFGNIACAVTPSPASTGRHAIDYCGQMMMGAMYFFKKPLPKDHVMLMHEMGPDTVLFGDDYEWNLDMVWSYNPSVWEGQYFLDSSSNFQEADPLQSAARRLDGTYHIYTRSAIDVLDCIGGISVLFPLFAQFDTQTSLDLNANVLKLFCAVLKTNVANQRYMQDYHGFLVTGYLLSRISPNHMTLQALNAIHLFVMGEINESLPFQTQALRHWLADFSLWVFTPLDIQIHVVKILQRLVLTSSTSIWPNVLTVRKVLDDLRLFYWFTPPADVWDLEDDGGEMQLQALSPSHFEARESTYNKREWIHPDTKVSMATHLNSDDRVMVRSELWKLLDIICRQKATDLDQNDASALCGFLAFSGDERQKLDLLALLHGLLATSSLRQHLIGLMSVEARKQVNRPELNLDPHGVMHPISAFGTPIDGHDILFALVFRRTNVTTLIKLRAFELLVQFVTHDSQWTQGRTSHASVYLLCAMDCVGSYDDLAPLCFRLLEKGDLIDGAAAPASSLIHHPSLIPALLSSLLLCDDRICLAVVNGLAHFVRSSQRNALYLTPYPRLVVLILLRFSNVDDVAVCIGLLGSLILTQLQTNEDGWYLFHSVAASIEALVTSKALAYRLRCDLVLYVLKELSTDHVLRSPRQPVKASKWQYLSQDSERQRWFIFHSNMWHMVFAIEDVLFGDVHTPMSVPSTFAWPVATALIDLIQQLDMQYWLTFPLEEYAPHPWLPRKGGMVRVVIHLLLAGMTIHRAEAFAYLRAYVCDEAFPHARNKTVLVDLIRDVVHLLRCQRRQQQSAHAVQSTPASNFSRTLYPFVQELVRRHKGMLQLLLLDSTESVLRGSMPATDEDDPVLKMLQLETHLNMPWSTWDSVMPPENDELWHTEMKFQRIFAVAQATWPLVHWELLSTLCTKHRLTTPAMDIMLSNSMRLERSVWKFSSEAQEKQRLLASHTWQRILRSLTNERGPWGQQPDSDVAPFVSWKLDSSENHMRQRVKLKRHYNAKELPVPSPSNVLLLPQEAQISLATELLQAKALASYNEDFYRKYKLALDEVDDEQNQGAKQDSGVDSSFECEWIAKTKVMAGQVHIRPPYLILHLAAKKKTKRLYLRDLVQSQFRRYQFQLCALELFFRDGVSLFLNLRNRKTCQAVDQTIRSLQLPRLHHLGGRSPRQLFERSELTELWVQRKVSNFDYLMYLNTIAGRTYNDLAQYPIFPWILADYTSKTLDLSNPATFRNLERPIGVQSDQSMAFFTERYKVLNMEYQRSVNSPSSMDDMPQLPPFHYGTHYSTSAFVIGFLVRLQPFMNYHRRLQGGKLDHADRLFHSIDAAYKSCTSNPSDVRELIPEFFYLPDFLVNSSSDPLGTKQNGEVVHHVELPPWANDSPEEFIRLHRLALESEYVSLNLHHWVDLIFGYKQRPPLFGGTSHAVTACNVYFHLTYDGAVDLEKLKRTDPHLYETTLRQIDCFGQTPPQLLFRPHPKRYLATDLIRPIFQSLTSLVGYPRCRLSRCRRPLLYLSIDGDVCVGIDTNRNVSVHKWRELPPDHEPPYSMSSVPMIQYSLGVPFATHAVTTYAETAIVLSSSLFVSFRKHVFSCGHWDHSIRMTHLETGRTIKTLLRHHDVVTCIALSEDGAYLVSGSSDNTVMVWEFDVKADTMVPHHTLYGHDDGITCVAVSISFNLVISSSRDGTVIVHTLSNGRYLRTIRPVKVGSRRARLAWVGLTRTGQILTYCESNSTLYLYSINGKALSSTHVDQKLQAFYLTKVLFDHGRRHLADRVAGWSVCHGGGSRPNRGGLSPPRHARCAGI
ncbi:hypothetical protein, variant 7 [Aphanomyces invadans]|uniref:DUF4704 domain-containing protein n=1 Tax=Aphanomyces invadans TaxID=157072 RepID=A0A024UA94_9STRA|nr:hypothetical protein, variant 4 [Aphanomyces invadans]XP_008869131.1 hypothetical protein, variant 5 [Aphanomyces invadans]XP_008869132.1 hypothetical protein, variant 6 [Aphanomyces invadans]XP_008869133.1 hypothetical protein, variant 7 [Aphanomyces invadans]ETW02525.1 hypothetical protein, variant 4 [Aphanomyces invadans]ETW02526.1 hypothetical protein, variant 5 [Aphanomyces invadans]ETW02527.1 hypothetical protein, variant 6 [Aphanomyces invadans]ETW02528.1 hypothetical protein, vari|eukprot:XP_008869130.1 hypothetical protein, variant 4 [Aphanomyces invadans]